MKYITLEILNSFAAKFAAKVAELFVKKESGKGLSSVVPCIGNVD